MPPQLAAEVLLAGAVALAVAVGGALIWRKRQSRGLAVVGAAVGAAALGAAVGWFACLFVCEFVPVVSTSGGGYVSFAFSWQNEFDPLLTYDSARQIESAAARLNFALRCAGAAAGAVVALGVCALFWRERGPA